MVESYFWDGWAVFLYFAVVLGVGYASSLHKTQGVRDFSLGGKQMPWGAVMASILAAELSAGTFLGTPGEGYALHNFTYAQLALGTVLARIIVAYLFLRPFYDYNVISIYEFLERRFGVITKNVASGVFLITRLLASGTRLYVAAVVVVLGYEMVQGVSATNEQKIALYAGAVIIVTTLTTVYTAAGGIRAVVWTDVIQASVMGSAVIYAIYSLWQHIGGWGPASAFLTGPDDLRFFDSGLHTDQTVWENIKGVLNSEYTIWAALLGSTFTTMATHGTDQDMVQRMLTAKDHHKSRLALILSGLADIPINLAFLFIGILLAVYYHLHTELHPPEKNPEVFAYYILHELPTGARGLLIAGVLATAMGSLSTALNALATSFTQDFWRPYLGSNATSPQAVQALRWSTVGFALLLAGIGIATAIIVIDSPRARIIPVVLGVFGYTYGSLLGIFLVGLLTKSRGNDQGNIVAMICGFVVVALLSGLPWDILNALRGQSPNISSNMMDLIHSGLASFSKGWITPPPSLVQIEFPWRIMFGTIVTFSVALAFPSRIKAR